MSHIQSGQRKHKCEPCGNSFSQALNLKQHMHTIHEGHKDYKCEPCGKSFSQAGNLSSTNTKFMDYKSFFQTTGRNIVKNKHHYNTIQIFFKMTFSDHFSEFTTSLSKCITEVKRENEIPPP